VPSVDAVDSARAGGSALGDFLRILRRRLPLALLVAVLLPSAALVLSLITEKKYTATAKLLFRDPGFDQKLYGSSPLLAPSVDPAREAATNVSLVSLDTISGLASRALGRRLSPSEIRDRVAVSAQGQSNVIVVMATDRSPAFAAKLANTTAMQYIDFRRESDRSKLTSALKPLRSQVRALKPADRNGDDGQTLKDQIGRLRVLASLQTGNAELVQPAQRPATASSPKPFRNVFIGLIGGIILGMGLALLLDRLDRRVRDQSDAEAIFERPLLGVIPERPSLRTDGGEALSLSGPEGEAFRALRTNLRYFDVDHDIHSLLITSSAPGDGKSTIARYLAMTAAASNVRVILLEADLRRPVLGNLFGDLHGRGLTNVLADHDAITDVIQRVPLQMGGLPDMGLTLDVVTSGPIPPNPTDLLESDRMRDVLAELEEHYDLVVIDTSPLTVVPDAVPVLGRVSGVVVVIRDGKSTRAGARDLRKQLDNLNISPLGIVMNGSALAEKEGSYGYYQYRPLEQASGDGSSNGGHPSRWPSLRRRGKAAPGPESAAAGVASEDPPT